MSVAPTVAELPLQDIRFLFGTIPQIRMLPDKLKQTGTAGIGEFKLVAHFPASSGATEADKKAYLNRHAGFQGGDYGIYYDGTYSLDEINWDATNRAGVHLVTQDKYGNTVQFPVVPSKSVPGDLKLLVSEYVESILNPPLMVRCSAIGGRLTPDPNAANTFDLSVNPQQPKCPVKARPHVPQQYHAEEMTMDHGRYVVDASALTDAEIEYLDFYLYGAETFNSPYAGSGALSDVGLSTSQLTSTVGSGTFDEASLNSSGHMNVFANAEDEDEEPEYPCDICGKPAKYNFQDTTIRYEIVNDEDFENPKVSDYGGDNQNDFYCEVHAKQYEGSDFHTLRSEEGSTPVQDPMEFGEMANWRPLDGTPGLKRQRAETLRDSGQRNAYATVNFEWTCQGLPEGFDNYSEIEQQVVNQIGYVTDNINMDFNRHYDTMEVEIDGVFYPCEFEYQLEFDEINYHGAEDSEDTITMILHFTDKPDEEYTFPRNDLIFFMYNNQTNDLESFFFEQTNNHSMADGLMIEPHISYNEAVIEAERMLDESNAENFNAYSDPISERQVWKIGQLGGKVSQNMNRSQASDYIKDLMGKPSGTWKKE